MIDINRADVEKLQKIKGIGRVTAERIIEYREAEGGFDSLEELTNISGIGRKSLAQLEEELTIEGGQEDEKVEIKFDPQEYGLGNLGEVHLVGEMNGWNPADKSYSLQEGEDGVWRNEFTLEEGTEYKILYDTDNWDSGNEIGAEHGMNFEV